MSATVGCSNLWVPDPERRCVFVAPSMVVHYVDAHGYQPPVQFVEAVTVCPPMRSVGYLRAIKECGIRR